MDRLVLDANVLFSAAYKANSRLLELWKLDDVVVGGSPFDAPRVDSGIPFAHNEDLRLAVPMS